MLRGTDITVYSDGIRISEEALATIGIFNQSNCWGLWVPDRNDWPGSEPVSRDHLLVSPFEPSSWPILFRVEIYLRDDRPGTLAAAIEPLASSNFNILAIDAVPAGHRHATVIIIGESMTHKHPRSFLAKYSRKPDSVRRYQCDETWEFIHQVYAPEMLRYSEQVKDAVMSADSDGSFLREIFLDPKHRRFDKGVLYDYSELPNAFRKLGEEQRTSAVTCAWLKNMAFFWLFGRNPSKAFELHYKGNLRLLSPIRPDKDSFSQAVAQFDPPYKTVASFNIFERFLRVMNSDCDMPKRTVRVTIPFDARYKPYHSTKGFQHNLYRQLSQNNLTLRSVAMSTQNKSLVSEQGKISMLVSSAEEDPEIKSTAELCKRLQEIADTSAGSIACNMSCSEVTVERFAAPILFFSTKFDWLNRHHKNLVEALRKMASEAGFTLLMGDMNKKANFQHIVPEISTSNSTTETTIKMLQNTDAFLQMIPKTVLKKSGNLNWLEFEFGAARALGIPCEIMVDLDGQSLEEWAAFLRVAHDFPFQTFDSKDEDEITHTHVRKAIMNLAEQSSQHQKLI